MTPGLWELVGFGGNDVERVEAAVLLPSPCDTDFEMSIETDSTEVLAHQVTGVREQRVDDGARGGVCAVSLWADVPLDAPGDGFPPTVSSEGQTPALVPSTIARSPRFDAYRVFCVAASGAGPQCDHEVARRHVDDGARCCVERGRTRS